MREIEMRPVPGAKLPREKGQILILTALFLILLLVLAGSAYDYASIVVEENQLQNGVDAAGLAGAQALSSAGFQPPLTQVAIAERTAREYLRLDGFATTTPGTNIVFTFPTSTAIPSTTPSGRRENINLDVTKNHVTYFWPLVGIEDVDVRGRAGAHASRGLVDVMMSLDTTGSMELSGTADFPALRQAVVDFINQLNPTASDPLGPQIGIARFAGSYCNWNRGRLTPTATGLQANGDTIIDLWRGAGNPNPNATQESGGYLNSEYVLPCPDDKAVLSGLTQNKTTLLKIATNAAAGTCPAGAAVTYGCPLRHVAYSIPVNGTAIPTGTPILPTQWRDSNGDCDIAQATDGRVCTATSYAPHYTGTKLPNGITVFGLGTGAYSFATANGGRNNSTTGIARKVVIMMTDGFNENYPNSPGNPASDTTWDALLTSSATALKRGADGTTGTPDDVEIYTIGFFCYPYNTTLISTPGRWCKSQ